MSGIGVPELLVITLVVALLFGAPVLTFFLGYVLGQRRSTTSQSAGDPAPTPEAPPSTPEEPADE